MNKKDPLRTIKYFTIFTNFTSEDSEDSEDSMVFYLRLSNIYIPL